MAPMIRPQLASVPYTAVFTRFEPTIFLAMTFASRLFFAPCTWASISFVAPSPSLAISLARSSQVSKSAFLKTYQSGWSSVRHSFSAQPFAITNTMSFVDVSPSTVIWLNETSVISRSAFCSAFSSIAASVVTNPASW